MASQSMCRFASSNRSRLVIAPPASAACSTAQTGAKGKCAWALQPQAAMGSRLRRLLVGRTEDFAH
jgi:hypothetical protein